MREQRRKDRGKSLRDLMPSTVVVQHVRGDTNAEVITELLNSLVIEGVLDLSRERGVLDSLLEREKVASTGIGNGLAIPHAKSKFAESFGVAVGLSQEGIDFHAHDEQPARAIFLWVCPPASTKEHLALMRGLAAMGQDRDNIDRLVGCRDRKALLQALAEVPVEQKGK